MLHIADSGAAPRIAMHTRSICYPPNCSTCCGSGHAPATPCLHTNADQCSAVQRGTMSEARAPEAAPALLAGLDGRLAQRLVRRRQLGHLVLQPADLLVQALHLLPLALPVPGLQRHPGPERPTSLTQASGLSPASGASAAAAQPEPRQSAPAKTAFSKACIHLAPQPLLVPGLQPKSRLSAPARALLWCWWIPQPQLATMPSAGLGCMCHSSQLPAILCALCCMAGGGPQPAACTFPAYPDLPNRSSLYPGLAKGRQLALCSSCRQPHFLAQTASAGSRQLLICSAEAAAPGACDCGCALHMDRQGPVRGRQGACLRLAVLVLHLARPVHQAVRLL